MRIREANALLAEWGWERVAQEHVWRAPEPKAYATLSYDDVRGAVKTAATQDEFRTVVTGMGKKS